MGNYVDGNTQEPLSRGDDQNEDKKAVNDVLCICGAKMNYIQTMLVYGGPYIICDGCRLPTPGNEFIYHCHNAMYHANGYDRIGYDLCIKCGIKTNDGMKNKQNEKNEKPKKSTTSTTSTTKVKRKRKKIPKEEEKDDTVKNQRGAVTNGLVLLLGITEYEYLKDLKGVKQDIAAHRKLWRDHYNYHIFPSKHDKKWYKREYWTKEDIEDFIEEGRELLFNKNSNSLQHDSIIVIICGHGGKDVIIASDYNKHKKNEQIQVSTLHAKLDGNWKRQIMAIPKLFIVDCCRGRSFGKPDKTDRSMARHRDKLLCSLYGTSPGTVVSENKSGGYFSQCLIKILKKTKNSDTTLSELADCIDDKLEDISNGSQECWKEGHSKADKIIFMPNKKESVDGDRGDDSDESDDDYTQTHQETEIEKLIDAAFDELDHDLSDKQWNKLYDAFEGYKEEFNSRDYTKIKDIKYLSRTIWREIVDNKKHRDLIKSII